MEKLCITGGQPLKGTVTISGAKNAALPIMAASLLAFGNHRIENIPDLRDIRTMVELLTHVGASVTRDDNALIINNRHLSGQEAPYDLVKTMRASVLVMGPLLGQLRRAQVSLPGGCAIGARPIDLHLKALEQMGASVELKDGYVDIYAPHLHGAHIAFDKVTVTGTENIIMAAVLADGQTIIHNAAKEPEVIDLANYLICMGADITGAGTDIIIINGVKKLNPTPYQIIPDRIEAGTFLIAAGMTHGDITIQNFPPHMLDALITRLRDAGMTIDITGTTAHASAGKELKPIDITTSPFPGFATDLQAQFMALMTLANGTCIVNETIFENRYMHVPELVRMGATISVEGNRAVIRGVPTLKGAPVMATDLRASASLVLAGLAAKGTTEIHRIYHLDRGYENIEHKLKELGANIDRQPDTMI